MAAFEKHTIPVISTAHIDLATNSLLDRNPAQFGAGASYEGCGYFLYLDEPQSYDGHEVPQCLLDIRDWLRKCEATGELDNCRWVRLDCDADSIEGLPTYNW